MTTVELTTSELIYTIGALEMALKQTIEFRDEAMKSRRRPLDVTESAIAVYVGVLTKLQNERDELFARNWSSR
jgi:hypothetical protein